jgi:hypothetical protein
MPQKVAIKDPDGGIPLETIRRVMERVDRQMVDVTPVPPPVPLDHGAAEVRRGVVRDGEYRA